MVSRTCVHFKCTRDYVENTFVHINKYPKWYFAILFYLLTCALIILVFKDIQVKNLGLPSQVSAESVPLSSLKLG